MLDPAIPFHPLAAVFPLMEGAEFEALVADIKLHGVIEPITLHDGAVLDGRNRYHAARAAGVERVPSTKFKGADPLAFVISRNLKRRHLTKSQAAMVALKIETLKHGGKRATAATKQDAQVRLDIEPEAPAVTRDEAAALMGVSPRYVDEAKELTRDAPPELVKAVEDGKVSLRSAVKTTRKKKRQARVAKAAASVPPASKRYRLIHGPLGLLLREPPGSADIVCTDPPYPREHLPVFGELASVAAHLLKPGGLLLCMAGQSYLPDVIAALASAPGLAYHWTLAYLTPGGQAVQVFPRKVNTFWKPVLMFRKGDYGGDWFGDVARSSPNDNDKDHHHWGQSESGMADLMQRFVRPGHVVVDPFLGGGTTAVVALRLGATFLGCDIDEAAITTSKARLANANLLA